MRKRNKKKKYIIAAVLATGLFIFFLFGLDQELTVRNYTINTDRLSEEVRIVFLSDLHSCDYGEGQRELLDCVETQKPDIVLLGGDWMDDDFRRLPPERAFTAAEELAGKYPTFYVSGNHEVWSGKVNDMKTELSARGVMVLSGEKRVWEVRGQTLEICGVDDPSEAGGNWNTMVDRLRAETEEERFSVLLSHRPERVEAYFGFDLVLAGHAHGGQWRIPGWINGLIAPNQGLFPKYAGGMYTLEDGGTLIVGRGLARESTSIPRFYNPPEVVAVDLTPEKGESHCKGEIPEF